MTDYTANALTPHPEGGRFREVFRSDRIVVDQGEQQKSALTHIYFNLRAGEQSRFHRVVQEEVWNLYRGAIRIWTLDPDSLALTCTELSTQVNTFCFVIPAGHWQAAEPVAPDVLVGCSVAPGFDFSDFELISPENPLCPRIRDAGLEHLL